jgi:hypothetical protein
MRVFLLIFLKVSNIIKLENNYISDDNFLVKPY